MLLQFFCWMHRVSGLGKQFRGEACPLWKYADLSSHPQDPHKKLGMAACTCKPSTVGGVKGAETDLKPSQTCLLKWKADYFVRDPTLRKWDREWEETASVLLWPVLLLTWARLPAFLQADDTPAASTHRHQDLLLYIKCKNNRHIFFSETSPSISSARMEQSGVLSSCRSVCRCAWERPRDGPSLKKYS